MPSAAEAARIDGGHGGVVIVNPDRFSLSRRNPGPLIAVLAEIATSTDLNEVVNNVMWL